MRKGILACVGNWERDVACGQEEPGLWVRFFLTLKSGPEPCQVYDLESII